MMKRTLLCLLVLLPALSPAARVVRTAYYTEPGLSERRSDGAFKGMVIDYLAEISRVNDWRIEPVYCSYEEALKRLACGEIDLVGGVTSTPERREAFRFASYATGDYRPHLFVPPNSPCVPGRLSSWKGLEIAVGPGEQARRMLTDFLSAHGVDCRLRPYSNAVEASTAFVGGAVPAVYASGTEAFLPAKVLKSFPSVPCYFCTPRSKPELGREIDSAILCIQAEKPDFTDRLAERYFPVQPRRETNYTDEERRWLNHRIRTQMPVVVDLSPECPPYKWWDRSTGKPAGFVAHLLDEVSRRTGLTFTYLTPTTATRARARILRHEADLWCSYGMPTVGLPGLSEDIRVCDFELVLASLKDVSVDDLSETVLGVPTLDLDLQAACARAGVRNLVKLDTPVQAMDSLLDGTTDALAMTASSALLLRQKFHAEDRLVFHPLTSRIAYAAGFSIIPSGTSDPCLASIIRKCVGSFTRSELQAMSYHSFTDALDTPMLTDREWLMVIIAVLLLALVTLAVGFAIYNRRIASALTQARAGERARTQFLATMSHEIRTPLNAVISFSEFLLSPKLEQKDVASYADGIYKSSHVLLDLINDVLDLSKLEAGRVDMRSGVLDVRRLADDLSRIFAAKAAERGLSLEFAFPDSVQGLRLSPHSFRQVLLNLIGNAVKFTHEGSVVTTFSTVPIGPSSVDVQITVKDTGIGISAEALPTIFDPFAQDISTRGGRVYEGTGLGLPIVKRIVEMAGGTVSVASEIGKGTSFTLRIPAVGCVPLADGTGTVATPSADVRLPESVILVDDVAMNLRVLSLHLTKLGVKDVRQASSGKEALSLYAERPAELVLTDMWMPGMDGTELANRLRVCGSHKDLRIVAVTADAGSSSSFDMSAFSAVITKPVTREKLLAAFRGVVK